MTPELEAKIRAAFLAINPAEPQSSQGYAALSNFTDGYLAGRASVLDGMEQVGWQHDSTARYDMIHTEVKELLARSGGHLLRPLDKTEHYTIPLYRLSPQLQEEKEKK